VPFPDSFRTQRLLAERLTLAHADDIRRQDRDPDLMGMMGGPREEAVTAAYLERNLRHWTDFGFGLWVLRDAVDRRVAGRAVLRHLEVEGTDEIEVGYAFVKEFWGRGLATEIARECVRQGHGALGFPSIVAITRPFNLGSQRVMEKVGMVFEREILHDGIPHVLFRSRASS